MNADSPMQARFFDSLEGLSETYAALISVAGQRRFFDSLGWYRNLNQAARDEFRLHLCGLESEDGLAAALLPMRIRESGRRFPYYHRLESLTDIYTVCFEPIVADLEGDVSMLAGEFAKAFAQDTTRWGRLRFDALDRESGFSEALAQALRSEGYLVHSYFQFANWYEDIEERPFAAFWASRPSALRHLVERKSRRLARAGSPRFEMVKGVKDLERCIEAYEAVYRKSWKQPEPAPLFMAGLIREAAAAGCLRLGLLCLDGTPIAAQVWIVSDRKATIFKLAHDEAYKSFSCGSLLTHQILGDMIMVEHVRSIDFGRGDDPFKRYWLNKRREKWGLLAFHRRVPGALLEATRHLGASRIRQLIGQ
jgi:hypothetical protein